MEPSNSDLLTAAAVVHTNYFAGVDSEEASKPLQPNQDKDLWANRPNHLQ